MLILKKRRLSLFYRWATTSFDVYHNVATLNSWQYMKYIEQDGVYALEDHAVEFLRSIKTFKMFKWFGPVMDGVQFTPSYGRDAYESGRNGFSIRACQGRTWVGAPPPLVLFHRKRDAIRFAVRHGRLRDPSYQPYVGPEISETVSGVPDNG